MRIILLLCLIFSSTPAFADAYDGFHVGVQAGVETNKIDSAKLYGPLNFGTVSVDKDSTTGATFGINAGYDKTLRNNIVIGAEIAGTFTPSGTKQSITFSAVPMVGGGTAPATINVDYKSDFTFEATARAGLLIGSRALVYGRFGYANSKLNVKVSAASASTYESVQGNNNGWVGGGGLELALSPSISARAEYKYFDLGQYSKRNQGTVSLVYSFGGAHRARRGAPLLQ